MMTIIFVVNNQHPICRWSEGQGSAGGDSAEIMEKLKQQITKMMIMMLMTVNMSSMMFKRIVACSNCLCCQCGCSVEGQGGECKCRSENTKLKMCFPCFSSKLTNVTLPLLWQKLAQNDTSQRCTIHGTLSNVLADFQTYQNCFSHRSLLNVMTAFKVSELTLALGSGQE